MSAVYQIAGYNKETKQLAYGYEVPEGRLLVVMAVVQVSLEAAAEFGPVLLDPATVRSIGRQLNKNIYSDLCDWVLEPFGGSGPKQICSPLPYYRV